MEWYLKVLKNYATFSGRARRKEYWMFFLFNVIFSFLAAVIDNIIGIADPRTGYGVVYVIYSLAVFIPGLAVLVRRLHDTGKSGWMVLVGLIPLAGAIWLLILMVTEGDKGANEYGPDPKDPNSKMSNDDLLDDTL